MFEGAGDWGRRIFGPEDVNWDHDSVMCVEFERNRSEFFSDLKRFVIATYPTVAVEDLILVQILVQTKEFMMVFQKKNVHL